MGENRKYSRINESRRNYGFYCDILKTIYTCDRSAEDIGDRSVGNYHTGICDLSCRFVDQEYKGMDAVKGNHYPAGMLCDRVYCRNECDRLDL